LGSLEKEPFSIIIDMMEEGVSTVFFSDLHVGDGKSKHKELLAYLVEHQKDIDKIVIVGDFVDTWVADLNTILSEAQPFLEFLATNYKNKVHWILGNHDADFLSLKNVFPFIHKSLRFPIGDKIAVALHGNVLDDNPYLKTRLSRYVVWFINKFDKGAYVDTRRSLVSLSERIQNDPYDKILEEYEHKIVAVFDGKYDFVITGHSHQPAIKKINNLVYLNCGDQIQHSTVLIGKPEGFFLYDYINQKILAKYIFDENDKT